MGCHSFLKMGLMVAFFKYDGTSELNRELLNLLQTKLETISKFPLVILTGISLS